MTPESLWVAPIEKVWDANIFTAAPTTEKRPVMVVGLQDKKKKKKAPVAKKEEQSAEPEAVPVPENAEDQKEED